MVYHVKEKVIDEPSCVQARNAASDDKLEYSFKLFQWLIGFYQNCACISYMNWGTKEIFHHGLWSAC
jgi:hypothetical protein